MNHALLATKSALLLSLGLLGNRVFPAPTPPPNPQSISRFQLYDPIAIAVRVETTLGPPVVWASTLCEIVASFLAASGPSTPLVRSLLTFLTFRAPSAARELHISYSFLAGWLMAVLGGVLRLKCYRQLGPQFTYQLSVIDDHRLVTDGPYAVVRHPSYTAWIAFALGLMLVQTSPGSWVAECGLLGSLAGRAVVAAWVALNLYIIALVPVRIRREDKAMKKQFGEQWTRWASVTRYTLVPGLY